MPMLLSATAVTALMLAIAPRSAASAQVLNNLLLKWRAELDRGEESDHRDRGALRTMLMRSPSLA